MGNRLNFDSNGVLVKDHLAYFATKYKLNQPITRAEFIYPEKSTEEILVDLLATEHLEETTIPEHVIAAVAQRMLWLEDEVKQLRRTNRNIRSKNKRLQERNK
jgi:hypothetical protein